MFPCFADIAAAVPAYDRFPGISELEAATDALAATHPSVDVWTCGASRAGHPLRCLEIPGGPLHACLVGLPHPEEPVGTLALEYLLPLLAGGLAEELGFSFSVVKAADPDAARLNEAWFDDPCDLAGYLLRAYRPAPADQMEWSFPVEYGRYAFTRPLPEAAAVMEVIGRRPLDFYMAMHDSSFGGAYFYISAADAALTSQLGEVAAAAGLPLHLGEPEVPYARTLAPGVYEAFTLADEYDHHERWGADPAVVLTSGTASDAYAESLWDCFTLVAETPHFTSPGIADERPAGLSRRAAKLRGIEAEAELAEWLHERYVRAAAVLTRESPWQRAVHGYLASVRDELRAERRQTESLPQFEEEATRGQLLDAVAVRELIGLGHVGRFAAMTAAEETQDPELASLCDEAVAVIRTRAGALAEDGGFAAAPLRALVQCQVAALLCALVATRERYRPAHPRPPAARVPA